MNITTILIIATWLMISIGLFVATSICRFQLRRYQQAAGLKKALLIQVLQ